MNKLAIEPDLNDWMVFANQFYGVGQFAKALHCIRRATPLHGDYTSWAAALHSTILSKIGHYGEAERWSKKAIAMQSQDAFGWSSYAFVYFLQHDYPRALVHYKRANELDPQNADIVINMALAHLRMGHTSKALHLYEDVVRMHPLRHDARVYLGMTMMAMGCLSGAAHFEARHLMNPILPQNGTATWEGQSLEGKSIAVYMEQGFGDTIMCSRYLPALLNGYRANVVYVSCQPQLRGILAKTYKGTTLEFTIKLFDEVPKVDYQIASMSLPAVTNQELMFSAPIGQYIVVAPKPERDSMQMIGLCWRGAPGHFNDNFRSMSLAKMIECLPSNSIGKCMFFPLQQEMTKAEERLWKSVFGQNPLCQGTTFQATAELVNALNLVISVDTAVAHLAGAMEVPVWILLPAVGDWRWGITGNQKRWYRSATLIRQKKNGIWRPVVNHVKKELRRIIQAEMAA